MGSVYKNNLVKGNQLANCTNTQNKLQNDEFKYWAKCFLIQNESQESSKSPKKCTSVTRSIKSVLSGQSGLSSNVTFFQIAEEGETEPSVSDVFFELSFFLASMLATVLEDSLTSLRLLEECNTRMRIAKALDNMPVLLEIKFGVVPATDENELDAVDPKKINCDEYKLYKLERDRNYCNELITALYVTLAISRNFRGLWRHLNKLDEAEKHKEFLVEQETVNKTLARTLRRQLRQMRIHHLAADYDIDALQDSLRKQIQDADQSCAIRGRYVDNWQQARTEQHEEAIRTKEETHLNSIEMFKNRTEQESRVHNEVELLVSIAIEETLKKVEDLMAKYETDTEAIDLRIQIQKSEYQNAWERRRELEKTLSQHEKEMRSWISFKEERAAAQKYHQDMMNAAVIVQAWWRGLIVRLQLGPYRHRKRSTAKPKKK